MRSVYLITIALLAVSTCYGGLVGTAVDPNSTLSNWGELYNIDPVTGATSPLRPFFLYGIGDSPLPATIFGSSTINLYALNLDTNVVSHYNPNGALDLAYDGDHNVLYGVFPDSLVTISPDPCDYVPCPTIHTVGSFGGLQMWALGYVPGEGLYGVDGMFGTLWRIDPTNAALTAVGPTGVGWLLTGMGITDIEWDSGTGRMIATAGGPESFDTFGDGPSPLGPPLTSGKIYLLDRQTGALTLLNDNAPNFFGLAEATPEPGSFFLIMMGALAVAGGRLVRRRR